MKGKRVDRSDPENRRRAREAASKMEAFGEPLMLVSDHKTEVELLSRELTLCYNYQKELEDHLRNIYIARIEILAGKYNIDEHFHVHDLSGQNLLKMMRKIDTELTTAIEAAKR